MSDKIEQIFSEQNQQFPYGDEADDKERAKKGNRVRNRRRLIGLAAVVLLAVAVAPAVFRPSYKDNAPKAKTDMPTAAEQKLVTQVELNAQKAKKESEAQAIAQMSGEKVAKSLSSSNNMVRPNTRPSDAKKPQSGKPKAKDAAKSDQQGGKQGVAAADDPMGKTISRLQNSKGDLKPIKAVANGRYYIQVVATSNKAAAAVKKTQLAKLGLPVYTQVVKNKNTDLWSVRVGRFATQAQAAQALQRMKDNGIKGVITQPSQQAKSAQKSKGAQQSKAKSAQQSKGKSTQQSKNARQQKK